jgi:hypothetical protein
VQFRCRIEIAQLTGDCDKADDLRLHKLLDMTRVENEVGRGRVFSFVLPCVQSWVFSFEMLVSAYGPNCTPDGD